MPRLDDPFPALADPTRRAVLDIVRSDGPQPAGVLAARFPSMSRPAVSKHIRILKEAGLLVPQVRGREIRYALDPEPLRAVYLQWLERFAPLWEASLAALKDNSESD